MNLKPFIILDCDDTIWPIKHVYNEAKAHLANFLISKGANKEFRELYEEIEDVDRDLYKTMGYSIKRFPESFKITANNNIKNISEKDLEMSVKFAEDVFLHIPVPFETSLPSINEMYNHYNLGIITAGEESVQGYKLKHFGNSHLFNDAVITIRKTAEVFEDFCYRNLVDIKNSFMIGDSLSSDIRPADSVGLNTILISENDYSSDTIHDSHLSENDVPKNTVVKRNLSEAWEHIYENHVEIQKVV